MVRAEGSSKPAVNPDSKVCNAPGDGDAAAAVPFRLRITDQRRDHDLSSINADYLVVGAGATGIGFADALIADSDATVVIADRRHAPGGHWNDAYPFVRLHQPSASYGVNSMELGRNEIDVSGPNAGFYEQASGNEIRDYFARVTDQLIASGQLTWLAAHEYAQSDDAGHRLVSRVTGRETVVRAGKLVDATYLGTQVPSQRKPDFEIDPGARVVTPNELAALGDPADAFTVIGAGKTAMDVCTWLMAQSVDFDRIRWVRPRDAWTNDRAFTQPLDLVGGMIEALAAGYEAAANATDIDDLFARAEDGGQIKRLDPSVEPDMYHGATLSDAELKGLTRISNVVRMGRVSRIESDRLVLEQGTDPTPAGTIHIDCTANGLGWAPPRPVFEADRITPQPTRVGMLPFSAALIGYLESTERSDEEKNRLTRPNPVPRVRNRLDWAWTTYLGALNEVAWAPEEDVQAWLRRSRVNIGRSVLDKLDDEQVTGALSRIGSSIGGAIKNLGRLLGETEPTKA